MKFIWQTWTNPPPKDSLGHGLCFFDLERKSRENIIAFVEGYEWYHGFSDTVLIYIIEPDEITPAEVLEELKQKLERSLKPKDFPHGMLTSRIRVWANA